MGYRISQQIIGFVVAGLLFSGCGITSRSEPTTTPTVPPTVEPTVEPTTEPTVEPKVEPTLAPTTEPTLEPTIEPTESAPIGATVGLLDPGKGFVEMYEAPNPNASVIATIMADRECIVVSGPRTAAGVTFWELDCPGGVDPYADREFRKIGWIDVTFIIVLD